MVVFYFFSAYLGVEKKHDRLSMHVSKAVLWPENASSLPPNAPIQVAGVLWLNACEWGKGWEWTVLCVFV